MSFMNWQRNMVFVRPGAIEFAMIPRVVKIENREYMRNNIFEKIREDAKLMIEVGDEIEKIYDEYKK